MKTKDVLGCVGWAAFFLLASAWIPFVGPFFSLLTPLPFLYYATKLGLRQGAVLALLTTLSIGLAAKVGGIPQVTLFCLEFSLLGLVLSELFRRGFSLGQTVFFATAFILLVSLGILFFLSLSRDIGPLDMVFKYLEEHIKLTIKSYEHMGVPQEGSAELESYAKLFLETVRKIYPSIMIIGTGFAVWINVVTARPLFRVGRLEYPPFVSADRWKTPDPLVWVVIASGFALFLTEGSIRFLAVNALIIMMAIYVFHGLSILLFFLNKYRVPIWVRVGIYFLIAIQQLFLILLSLAGLFDQWIDFRRIYKRADR